MTLSPLLLLALAFTSAHAEIYRCSGTARMPVYQNFPCEFDRPASASSSAPTSATPTGKPDANAKTAGAGVTPTTGVTPTLGKPSPPAEPRVGMTTEEVRAIWGEPNNLTTEEFAKRDLEIWTYADSRSIEFDRKGRVTAIRW